MKLLLEFGILVQKRKQNRAEFVSAPVLLEKALLDPIFKYDLTFGQVES